MTTNTTFTEMKIIPKYQAEERFKNKKEVYGIYKEGSEYLIESEKDFSSFDLFAIENTSIGSLR